MDEFRLTLSSSVEEQGRTVVLPWLRRRSLVAWQYVAPTVVLVPTRLEGFYWKQQLAESGQSLLGISFWIPSDLRTFLTSAIGGGFNVASMADLELLARVAAESVLESTALSEEQRTCLESMRLDPTRFLVQYEMLVSAGWQPVGKGREADRLVARQFQTELATRGLMTQAESHRALREHFQAQTETVETKLLAQLLITGFNGTHWAIFDLLAAGTSGATDVTVSLLAPQSLAETPDQQWVSAWEQWAGKPYEEPFILDETGPAPAPFSPLGDLLERGELAPAAIAAVPTVGLTIGLDLATHARAIVTRILMWLKEGAAVNAGTRIGIIFPEVGALSLAVCEQLRQLGVAFNDATGYRVAGVFGEASWQRWLALQEEPTAKNFVAWYSACQMEARREEISAGVPVPATETGELSLDLRLGEPFDPAYVSAAQEPTAQEMAKAVSQALHEYLVDDLRVIEAELRNSSDLRELRMAEIMANRIQLPDQGTFQEFLNASREALNMSEALEQKLLPWARSSDIPGHSKFSKKTFLAWLKATTDQRARERDTSSTEYYGRVHVTLASQMGGQRWSHLLLAEMNRGVWPRDAEETIALSGHALRELNQAARRLNRIRAEGGESATGFGYCLSPFERPLLALRDLCWALENTEQALHLTATLKKGDRLLSPNDLFAQCYRVQNGKGLDDEKCRALANEVAAVWGSRRRAVWEMDSGDSGKTWGSETFATAFAHRTRRNVEEPFGPFQFCFASDPKERVQLSCKAWEDAWRHPADAWLRSVVGVKDTPVVRLSWGRGAGTWLHRWMSGALKDLPKDHKVEWPELLERLQLRTEGNRRRIEEKVHEVGASLAPWWSLVFDQHKHQAEALLKGLSEHVAVWEIYPEARLPDGIKVAVGDSERETLELFGRLDCLLVERGSDSVLVAEPTEQNTGGRRKKRRSSIPPLEERRVWVIDFKTGTTAKLNAKSLEQGKGWQPVLYAWALQKMGALEAHASLMMPGDPAQKQVCVAEAIPLMEPLRRMHVNGFFGQKAADNYAYSPDLPIACLLIPAWILKAKAIAERVDAD